VKVIDFIFAARPMLLLPVWSIFLITKHFYFGETSLEIIDYVVLTCLTFLVAGAYYINQVYDYQSDLINKKLGFLQSGKISKNEMIFVYLFCSVISVITGFKISIFLGALFCVMLALGFTYSAPPLRLKDRPIAGLLSNSIAYGILVPLTIPGFIERVEYLAMILPTYLFLTVSAGYLLTILPDRDGDAKTGKQTLAVILSDRTVISVAIVLLLFSVLIAWQMNHLYLMRISSVSLLLYVVTLIYPKSNLILLACKLPILLMSILAGYYYHSYFIFLIALLFLTRLYYKKRFGIVYPRIS